MGDFLYGILIYPIELLLSYIYAFFFRFSDTHGIAIVGISFAVNILSFPLYDIAEKIQRKERDAKRKLQSGINRIKAVFSGDEQYMILSTFYRQNHYHPAYALRSSVSLMIQVPFFIAAYSFLSNLASLNGQSFFFIHDLGLPDGLWKVGSFSINILPIAMTLINLVAGLIYTKGFMVREKVQLFGMAFLFLVILYGSPSALVLYWTLNNLVSLVKNLLYRVKHPAKVLYISAAALTIAGVIAFFVLFGDITTLKAIVVVCAGILVVLIPLLLKGVNWLYQIFLSPLETRDVARNKVLLASGLLLWVLCGLFIPASLIFTSPLEFSFTGSVSNPLSYVWKAVSVFLGICVIWPAGMYAMASKKAKTYIAFVLSWLSITALFNTFAFPGDYGTISNLLILDNASLLLTPKLMMVLPLLASFVAMLALLFIIKYGKAKWVSDAFSIVVVGLVAISLYHCWDIQSRFSEHAKQVQSNESLHSATDTEPIYQLSKNGKNVIVFFLDRAISAYLPYIFEEKPQLKEQFDGFTYYPNTVSFAANTLLGSPPLMGGYEYTPQAMNERNTQRLVDKHNESLLLLPRLFSEAGYSASVTNPPWSNYAWEADYTPFKQYPQVKVLPVEGKYTNRYMKEHFAEVSTQDISDQIKTNLPRFSLFRVAYPFLRKRLYDDGRYFSIIENESALLPFLDTYAPLYYLPELTETIPSGNTYTLIENSTPHQPIFLEAPMYEPREVVTNTPTPFDQMADLNKFDIQTYQVNVASLLRIGLWLDTLKKEGVYENTRIIMVSDHGYSSFNPRFKDFGGLAGLAASFNALLMEKDFGSKGSLVTNNDFMTTADTPLLALEDLGISYINPFTGNDIRQTVDKNEVHSYMGNWSPANHGEYAFTFDYGSSLSIKDSVFEVGNWRSLK